jgi:hypothetical protein
METNKKGKLTQKQALLKLMLKGKPVDFIKAYQLTGCTKLSTRVSEFINAGFRIDKKVIAHETRYGTKGYHFSYTLDAKHAKKSKLI